MGRISASVGGSLSYRSNATTSAIASRAADGCGDGAVEGLLSSERGEVEADEVEAPDEEAPPDASLLPLPSDSSEPELMRREFEDDDSFDAVSSRYSARCLPLLATEVPREIDLSCRVGVMRDGQKESARFSR